MIDIVIPVRDFYRNIPGQGKVKELTKGKSYEFGGFVYNGVESKHLFIRTDLGDMKVYYKKNMFITKSMSRDNKLKELGI
jgi:hypothetical protein